MVRRVIVYLNKGAEQVVVHKPEVREVTCFRFLAFESIFEKVVKQFISHFVARWTHPRLYQLC